MPGPGEYLADVTEAITRVGALPKANIITRHRNSKHCTCPRCSRRAYRWRGNERLRHDGGALVSGRPHDLHRTYSQPHCSDCGHCFNADMSEVALPGTHSTHRVVAVAGRLVVE